MRRTVLGLIMALAGMSAAWAQSNIGLTQYPGPDCTKPVLPQQPEMTAADRNNAKLLDDYNAKVQRYNAQVQDYDRATKA